MMPFAMVCLFMACKKETQTELVPAVENLTTVKYKIEVASTKTKVQYPINGRNSAMFSEVIEGKDEGSFEFKVTEPGYCAIFNTQYSRLFVEPGQTYELQRVGNEYSVKGINEHGQQFINRFRKFGKYDLIEMYSSIEMPFNETISKVHSYYNKNLHDLDSLQQSNLVTDTFYSYLKKDIESLKVFAQSEVLANLFHRTTYPKEYSQYLKEMPAEAIKLWEDTFTNHAVSNFQLKKNIEWLDYAMNYVFIYHAKYKLGKNFDFDNEDFYLNQIEFAKTVLNGETLEYFIATYLYFNCIQRNFKEGIVRAYEQFERDYPNSLYSTYLKNEIGMIRDYHKKVASDFSENVNLKSSVNLTTLADVIAQYKGENLYIDVWASWCGPCKDEFQFGKELKQYLKQQNIKMIYISIDEDRSEKAWKNMIKYYELNGDHYRCNKELKEDLFKEYSNKGYISVPWYIIVNKKGEIVKRHAKRPSEKDSLCLQLEETLQLK